MGSPAIFAGNYVKLLKNQLKIGDDASVLTGTDDPTSVAKDAPKSSLYLRDTGSSGQVYIKLDDGSSTNWELVSTQFSNVYDAVVYVDKSGNDTTGNGSNDKPFLTIQKGIDTLYPSGHAVSAADERKRKVVYINAGAYDEALTIPSSGHLALLATGPVTLGDAASTNAASTTPRNITWAQATTYQFGQLRPTLLIASMANIDTSSTHIAYAGSFSISGSIVVSDNIALTAEMQLIHVKCYGTLTCTKTGIFNTYYDKCLFASSSAWGNSLTNINLAYSSEFDGAITAGQVGRMEFCEIANGITLTSLITSIPPYGFYDCLISGTFTGPANSYRVNGATRFMSSPTLAGGATETILDKTATSSVTGLLSSTDWSTFNNKQAGPLTGDVTTSGAAATLATVNSNVGSFTNASVTVNAKGLVTAASSGTAPVTSVGATSPITSSGGVTPTISTSIATNKLVGRSTAGTGVMEEIAVGAGLSLSAGTLTNTISISSSLVGVSIDGGGTAIGTGQKGYFVCPFAGTITGWDIVADQSGSIVFDVWKANNAIPTVANTITASAKPTLSSQQLLESTTLTGWTTSVAAGDVFGFNVDSIATLQKVTLTIRIQRA